MFQLGCLVASHSFSLANVLVWSFLACFHCKGWSVGRMSYGTCKCWALFLKNTRSQSYIPESFCYQLTNSAMALGFKWIYTDCFRSWLQRNKCDSFIEVNEWRLAPSGDSSEMGELHISPPLHKGKDVTLGVDCSCIRHWGWHCSCLHHSASRIELPGPGSSLESHLDSTQSCE